VQTYKSEDGWIRKCNKTLRVLYGKPFPESVWVSSEVLGKVKTSTVAEQKEKREAP
jgi:hypothetical protein